MKTRIDRLRGGLDGLLCAKIAAPLAIFLAVGCGGDKGTGGSAGTAGTSGSGAGATSGSGAGATSGAGASTGKGASATSSSGSGDQSSAATGSGGSGSGGSGSGSGGSGSGGSAGWGPNDPGGETVAPFGYFKAFRSGCGEELWTRFIPTELFALGQVNVTDSGGGSDDVQYFCPVPEFSQGVRSVWLVDGDNGGWNAGTGSFALTVELASQSVLTPMITAPLDGLFKWPGQIDYVSAFNDPAHGLQITIDPHISGSVVTMRIYDGATECRAATNILQQGVPITAGNMTQISTEATGLTKGKTYLLVLQGVSSAISYDYYATLEFPAP